MPPSYRRNEGLAAPPASALESLAPTNVLGGTPPSSILRESSGMALNELPTSSRVTTTPTVTSIHLPSMIVVTSKASPTFMGSSNTGDVEFNKDIETLTESILPTSSPITISFTSGSMTMVIVIPTSGNSSASTNTTSSTALSPVTGAVLGVFGALAIFLGILLFLCMRKARRETHAIRKISWDIRTAPDVRGSTTRSSKDADVHRLHTLNRVPRHKLELDAGPAAPAYTERDSPPEYTRTRVLGPRLRTS